MRDQIKSLHLLGYRGSHTKLSRTNSGNLRGIGVGNGAGGGRANGVVHDAQLGAPARAA